MYIGIIWYEEFDQIQGMNAVRKINQSIVRGGEDFIQLYTYNTPASRQHFVNKEKRVPKKTRLVHLSDYRSVPKEWLGQAFIDEAEFIKETAPTIYENEYLGLETGDGGNVFENLELREITDEEISHFDRLYKGIDWGWYPDPFAYNNMHFDMARRTLYIFDELRCNKTSNEETWKMLKEQKGVTNNDLITADIAKDFNIDISTKNEVMQLIDLCSNIYNHKAPWLNEEVKSLNVAKTICEKVAKAVTIEFKSQVEDEQIDEIYQRFIKNIRTNTEYTLAKGGMFFKPFYANERIKINCVQGDRFIPVKFDSTGELLGAIFIDQIIKGNYVYTRLEYNDLNDTTLTIRNIAYKGNKNNSDLGKRIPLEQVPGSIADSIRRFDIWNRYINDTI